MIKLIAQHGLEEESVHFHHSGIQAPEIPLQHVFPRFPCHPSKGREMVKQERFYSYRQEETHITPTHVSSAKANHIVIPHFRGRKGVQFLSVSEEEFLERALS